MITATIKDKFDKLTKTPQPIAKDVKQASAVPLTGKCNNLIMFCISVFRHHVILI